MRKYFGKALLAGTAAAALYTGMPQPALAQSQMPGFFGSLTGWYAMESGDSLDLTKCCFFSLPSVGGGRVTPDAGWGGRAYVGYRFAGPWDIAVGLQGTALGRDSRVFNGGVRNEQMDAEYWAGDLEAGYNFASGGLGMRLFAGARYVEFDHDFRTRVGAGFQEGSYIAKAWGVGPRVGLDGSYRLGDSNFSLFADASASILFGKRRAHDSDGSVFWRGKNSETMFNAEGSLGLAYEIAPNVTIGAGYRVDFWDNASDKRANEQPGCAPPVCSLATSGRGERLMHGPFLRVAYNIGVPRPVAQLAVTPAGVPKNFIVFFDFDRSTLTPAARDTVIQAADAAKAGKSARVNVTGHADKSGADQYNMALSLRRANTVKDELVRSGVPAASIVVVGRGESQPLVPTADGIKEAQNRRVEIVLN